MKLVIGIPARGNNFFYREQEIESIKGEILSGFNIQLTAPRRVGKTSILHFFEDQDVLGNYHVVYVDTEATKSIDAFFKKLYSKILEHDIFSTRQNIINELKEAKNKWLAKIKGISFAGYGVELNEAEGIDYFIELENFLRGIDLSGEKILLMIDEFPETIQELEKKDREDAIQLLKLTRTLRQDPQINKKIQFIYTGSISLNATVAKLEATRFINDINTVKVDPLSKEEGKDFISVLTKSNNLIIREKGIDYFISKIEILIPFIIQLIIKELKDELTPGSKIDNEDIDKAIERIIEFRNRNYFEHYVTRLKDIYKNNDFSFVMGILDTCAKQDFIDDGDVFNLAVKNGVTKNFHHLLNALEYDGYISKSENGYYFSFTILKFWWIEHVL